MALVLFAPDDAPEGCVELETLSLPRLDLDVSLRDILGVKL